MNGRHNVAIHETRNEAHVSKLKKRAEDKGFFMSEDEQKIILTNGRNRFFAYKKKNSAFMAINAVFYEFEEWAINEG